MTISTLPLDQISLPTSILNRGGESDIVSDITFLELVNSIKVIKTLIHPITVRKKGVREYEVITGTRRLLAYKNLHNNGEVAIFGKIPTIVLDLDEATSHLYTHHENKFRTNPTSVESFEFKVSIVPFLFDKGVAGDSESNFKMGMDILQKYISLLVGWSKKEDRKKSEEKFEILKAFTGAEDPEKDLKRFFFNLGESPRYFWSKRKIFEYDANVYTLYASKKVSFNLAKRLEEELNKETPGVSELIVQSVESEDITSNDIFHKLRSLELENKREDVIVDASQVEKRVSTFRKINKMLKSDDRVFTEEMMENIDSYIDKIQEIIKGTQK